MHKPSAGAPAQIERRRRFAMCLAGAVLAASVSGAQFRGGRVNEGIRRATPQSFDGAFNFCRIQFRQNPSGDGNGWRVDYPRADENLSIRLSELTKTRSARTTPANRITSSSPSPIHCCSAVRSRC